MEFSVYEKRKGFQLTISKVVYSLLLTSIAIAYLADRKFGESRIEDIARISGIFGCVLLIYFKIAQNFMRESLNGKLNTKIKFYSDKISIDEHVYSLEQIKKIEFYICDYFNMWELRSRGDLNPSRTNGTSNVCKITLTNGEQVSVNFQLMYEDEFLKLKELLLIYHAENKIHFLKLIDYLKIDKYEDIQAFKKTL